MSGSLAAVIRAAAAVWAVLHLAHAQNCVAPPTIDFTIRDAYCNQPLFFNILTKNEENVLLDNVCATSFPLPDDPYTFIHYVSYVYCDGSNYVQTFILQTVAQGQNIVANPLITYHDYFVGYAGCDTYVGLRCSVTGNVMPPFIFGVSSSCTPIGLSCLRKVQEVIDNSCLPDQPLYVLPMKLPNRCVMQPSCTLVEAPNPFYNALPPSVSYVY